MFAMQPWGFSAGEIKLGGWEKAACHVRLGMRIIHRRPAVLQQPVMEVVAQGSFVEQVQTP